MIICSCIGRRPLSFPLFLACPFFSSLSRLRLCPSPSSTKSSSGGLSPHRECFLWRWTPGLSPNKVGPDKGTPLAKCPPRLNTLCIFTVLASPAGGPPLPRCEPCAGVPPGMVGMPNHVARHPLYGCSGTLAPSPLGDRVHNAGLCAGR